MLTDRLIMRRWEERDRAPFAALNADPEVMRYFRAPMSASESDAFVDRMEAGFDEHGFGLWALEIRETGEFIGFTGLAWQTLDAPFAPATEVGWRLTPSAWGFGYATEAARAALRHGFTDAGLAEIVSMTAVLNLPSQAVMRRLGMARDPADDFDHPRVPEGSPLRPHLLYRLSRERWRAQQ